jgi:esterase/lipase superfamily enzyme
MVLTRFSGFALFMLMISSFRSLYPVSLKRRLYLRSSRRPLPERARAVAFYHFFDRSLEKKANLTGRSICRLIGLLCLAPLLSGCWLQEGQVTGSAGRSVFAQDPTLLVVTNRVSHAEAQQKPWFGGARGQGLSVAKAHMIPPQTGLVANAGALLGSQWAVRDVVLQQQDQIKPPQRFVQETLGRDVLLYVHGYRETFETAAISAAELSDGIGFRGVTALFAWPSGGVTLDYAYDRESAMWSRDALEEILLAFAESPTGGKIHLISHSMGALLTLETLRQMRMRGNEALMARIGAIVMASPDIDIDLFTRTIERLGNDAAKITVITAGNDRALEISRRLAGGVLRAGAAERDRLTELGVRVADATDFGGGLFNHALFLRNEDVRSVVSRAIARAR